MGQYPMPWNCSRNQIASPWPVGHKEDSYESFLLESALFKETIVVHCKFDSVLCVSRSNLSVGYRIADVRSYREITYQPISEVLLHINLEMNSSSSHWSDLKKKYCSLLALFRCWEIWTAAKAESFPDKIWRLWWVTVKMFVCCDRCFDWFV